MCFVIDSVVYKGEFRDSGPMYWGPMFDNVTLSLVADSVIPSESSNIVVNNSIRTFYINFVT